MEQEALTLLWESGVHIREIDKVLTCRTQEAIQNKVQRLELQRPKPTMDAKLLAKYTKILKG